MADRDWRPRRRDVLDVSRDTIADGELAVLRQQHDAGRHELLADGRDLIHRLGGGWLSGLQTGHAIARGLDHLTVLDDGHREPGNVLPLHFRADEVIRGIRVSRGGGNHPHEADLEQQQSAKHQTLLPGGYWTRGPERVTLEEPGDGLSCGVPMHRMMRILRSVLRGAAAPAIFFTTTYAQISDAIRGPAREANHF